MRNFDASGMIVSYNFVIGVLTMLSSEKLAAMAGQLNRTFQVRITRVTYLTLFTIGSSWAFLAATVYIAFHMLRIGV